MINIKEQVCVDWAYTQDNQPTPAPTFYSVLILSKYAVQG